ncbi:MAG: GNAT family N-acetyltransferase [Planctomycetota bacterium]
MKRDTRGPEIRDFLPDDYAALVEIHNAVHPPVDSLTADSYRAWDRGHDPTLEHRRLVAVSRGRVVGAGQYRQMAGSEGGGRGFELGLGVPEEHRQQGIGSALYDRIVSAMARFRPSILGAHCGAWDDRSILFFQKRGFGEHDREGDYELDVTSFDPAPYEALEEDLRGEGIELNSISELADDPDRDRKLYDLYWALYHDVPGMAGEKPTEFETWRQEYLNAPDVLPDGYLIAVRRGRYIGQTTLWSIGDGRTLNQKITGVLPEYRRRGIPTALKVRGAALAREWGHTRILTENADRNKPICELNRRLGFVPRWVWVFFRKRMNGS